MTQVTAPAKGPSSKTSSTKNRTQDADSFAVAAFVLGLPGLLVGNVFLGPTAIILATLALIRGTSRQGRAWFGMVLGFADLAVLATLVTLNGTVSWSQ